MTTGDFIEWYLRLRKQKADMEERHKQELAPIQEKMRLIEAALQKTMLDQGTKQMKSGAGTAYLQTVANVKVVDWDTALTWIKENDRWDALERRINKTIAVEEDVPGVQVVRSVKTTIRTA